MSNNYVRFGHKFGISNTFANFTDSPHSFHRITFINVLKFSSYSVYRLPDKIRFP